MRHPGRSLHSHLSEAKAAGSVADGLERLDYLFLLCSHRAAFEAWQRMGARWKTSATKSSKPTAATKYSSRVPTEICKAAFEKALFVYPNEYLEIRQGSRIILKSKER
jgi:hypothetical protein